MPEIKKRPKRTLAPEGLSTTTQAANYLEIHPTTLRRFIKEGKLIPDATRPRGKNANDAFFKVATLDYFRQFGVSPQPTTATDRIPIDADLAEIFADLPFTAFARDVLRLSLTRAQLVLARVVFDGVDPIDLEDDQDRAIASIMFGGADRIPEDARRVIVLRLGRGSGKSTICAARSIHRMLTADLSSCGPGDVPAVVVVSPYIRTSKIALRMALAMIEDSPQLQALIRTRTKEEFTLCRPDGRIVQFTSIPKSGKGTALRGFSIIEALLDESEFVGSSGDGSIISDADMIDALLPRLMFGGSLLLCSTPWPAESETKRLFEGNFGRPSSALAAKAPTLLMWDFDPKVEKRITKDRERDAIKALREYDCEVTDTGGFYFEASSIDRATSAEVTGPRETGRRSAAIDLAFRGDSSALVITERQGDRLAVVHLDFVSPKPNQPLVPSQVIESFALSCKALEVHDVCADSAYIESARETFARYGIAVVEASTMKGQKDKAFSHLRTLLREGKIDLPKDARLTAQLKSVLARPMSGGKLSIGLPRAAGSGHADLVSALVEAVYHDRRFGPLSSHGFASDMFAPIRVRRPYEGLHTRRGGFQKW